MTITIDRRDAPIPRASRAVLGSIRHREDYNASATEVALPADSVTSVKIENLELCPHYTARVLRNVKIKPSPQWMQQRLEALAKEAAKPLALVYMAQTAMKANVPLLPTDEAFYSDDDDDGSPIHRASFNARVATHRLPAKSHGPIMQPA